jgi:hypothetical protein
MHSPVATNYKDIQKGYTTKKGLVFSRKNFFVSIFDPTA